MISKKSLFLLLTLLCSSVFALDTTKTSIDYKNEIYISGGLPSTFTLGESFINYASSKPFDADYYFLYPKTPNFEAGYNHYFSERLAIGINCNYEMCNYACFDSNSSLKKEDNLNHRFSILGNFSILFPKKYFISYIKFGIGSCIDSGPYWEKNIRFIPAVQVCPIGIKFLLKDNISIFTELNLGMNSLLSIGLSKGF